MDDQTEDWVELEYLTEISLSTIRRDMKYKLPPITGPLHLKVVCTEGPVRLHHIVTHLAFDANVPQETPSVDWGQIFGDITQQTDLQNALNALMPPDATTAKKGLVELATDAEMSEGTNPGVVPTVKQVSDKVAAASPVGKFDWHCGQTPPDGYLVCDGSALPRAVYPELFAVIGTKFGAGDGKTTFNIPRIPDFIRGAVGGRAVGSKQAHGAQRQSGYRMEASRGSETIHIQKIQFSATSSDVVADPTSAVISSVSVLFAKQLAGQVASYPLASFGNVYPPFNEAAENRPDNVALLPCIKY